MSNLGLAAIRLLHRIGVRRGLCRLSIAAAHVLPSLRCVKILAHDGRPLCVDLRHVESLTPALTGKMYDQHFEEAFMVSMVAPGETVFDVGAHIGWYSTLLARAVGDTGKVYAFEPGQAPLQTLTRTAQSYPSLHLVPLAVDDHEGEATLFTPGYLSCASLQNPGDGCRAESCKLTTLDSLWESIGCPQLSFIKMDIEGSERRALCGARCIFTSACPPACMIELVHNRQWIESFFAELPGRYSAFAIDSGSGLDTAFVPQWLQERAQVPVGTAL